MPFCAALEKFGVKAKLDRTAKMQPASLTN